MSKILIVDDEIEITELISDALEDEGLETIIKYDGETALEEIQRNKDIALIILDIMMPKIDGLELCRKIRDEVLCPIIFLTAKKGTINTVLGLEMGADDYITKPFVVMELVTRIKAHLRREKRALNPNKSNIIKIEKLEIHKESYEVFYNGEQVNLSSREFQLLTYLCDNIGIVLSREQIFDAVWGKDYGDIGTVAVNIKNLRDKIDKDGKYIKTIWGVGYKLINPLGDYNEN